MHTKLSRIPISLWLAVAMPSPVLALGPEPVDLGSTASFMILSGAGITSTGGGIIHGDVGASPITGAAIGIDCANVNGTIYAVDASGPPCSVIAAALLTTAKGDWTTAYNDAAGRIPVPSGPFLNPNGGNLGGLNLTAGLYKFTGTAFITGSDLTLTGGPTDVWIFQIAADLQLGSGISVVLAGGAQARNIFWQVGTSAVLGTSSSFKGTILAEQSVTMDTSSTLEGRALAFSAGVTFNANAASVPVAVLAAGSDAIQRLPGSPVKVAVAQLLSNDFDPEGAPLMLSLPSDLSANGASVTREGGWVIYSAPVSDAPDTFEYTLHDGSGDSAIGTVAVTVVDNTSPSSNQLTIAPDGNDIVIVFAGIAGMVYELQYTTDLNSPWIAHMAQVAGIDGKLFFRDIEPPPPGRYYRTVALRP